MANYYYTTIKSEKCSQEMANQILQLISEKNRICDFIFNETGYIFYETRGIIDISEILKKYNVNENEIRIEDKDDTISQTIKEQEEETIKIQIEIRDILQESIKKAIDQVDFSNLLKKINQ